MDDRAPVTDRLLPPVAACAAAALLPLTWRPLGWSAHLHHAFLHGLIVGLAAWLATRFLRPCFWERMQDEQRLGLSGGRELTDSGRSAVIAGVAAVSWLVLAPAGVPRVVGGGSAWFSRLGDLLLLAASLGPVLAAHLVSAVVWMLPPSTRPS